MCDVKTVVNVEKVGNPGARGFGAKMDGSQAPAEVALMLGLRYRAFAGI